MNIETSTEFPCGYKHFSLKVNVSAMSSMFGAIEMKDKSSEWPECPLHGKKCERSVTPQAEHK